MKRNRLEEADLRAVAEKLSLPYKEVRRAVHSFFDTIILYSRSLPFDDPSRIYSKKKFEEYIRVFNIPHIGRIGPVYSRYLKWRSNESKNIRQELRSNYRSRRTQDDIEHMADALLSGKTPLPVEKKKGSEMYNRVWLVDADGKRLARQVIPKEKEK